MSYELADPSTLFFHVRIFLGMIVSFCLVHIMRSSAAALENRHTIRLYWVHSIWVLSSFLLLVHFWWWELRFALVSDWTFLIFLFLVSFALLLGMFCYLLLPDQLREYKNYFDYFYARRKAIFGVLALIYAVDLLDTYLKGAEFFAQLGPMYAVRNTLYIVGCLVGIRVRNTTYHGSFAVIGLLLQVVWIFDMYERLR